MITTFVHGLKMTSVAACLLQSAKLNRVRHYWPQVAPGMQLLQSLRQAPLAPAPGDLSAPPLPPAALPPPQATAASDSGSMLLQQLQNQGSAADAAPAGHSTLVLADVPMPGPFAPEVTFLFVRIFTPPPPPLPLEQASRHSWLRQAHTAKRMKRA